ncbi:MAG: hypothetical protein ACRCZL_01900, partial [Cetobacterium sp.]
MALVKPNLAKPKVGGDVDIWGDKLNRNVDAQDSYNSQIVQEGEKQDQELARLERDKINKSELPSFVKGVVDNYVETSVKPDLNNHTNTVNKPDLNRHTDVKKTELNTFTEEQKAELDAHEKVKENEINVYVEAEKLEINTYVETEKVELNSY